MIRLIKTSAAYQLWECLNKLSIDDEFIIRDTYTDEQKREITLKSEFLGLDGFSFQELRTPLWAFWIGFNEGYYVGE